MKNTCQLQVAADGAGMWLDTWLARTVRVLSLRHIKQRIYEGQVQINGQSLQGQGRRKVMPGDLVEIELPPPPSPTLKAQAIPLDVIYEDADIIVINKPAGLLVHPACGHADGTLANALVHHCPDMIIGHEIRAGLVHRLDRETSGVLVAAKNGRALAVLARQFQRRLIRKEYLAWVWGHPSPPAGTVESLIGPDAADPRRMSATPATGRRAITHYATEQSVGEMSLLRVRIETGRTHQIRVHMAHIGHPVVGDRIYGSEGDGGCLAPSSRHLLHAHRIVIRHPGTNTFQEFTAPLPEDIKSRCWIRTETALGEFL